ncbi:hypothetical protein [Mesorhizobium sp. SP-1A]|uniref:hypothetical protein n=1 Tax=Mesorhizobium sp. SP-1A TaxID=3077840 RepID=UPI0028F6C96F|nr:hypothetical protein [Mesorhizobium sp. SP-1A]
MTNVTSTNLQTSNEYVTALAGAYKLNGPVTYTILSNEMLSRVITLNGQLHTATSSNVMDLLSAEGFSGDFVDMTQYGLMMISIFNAIEKITSYCNIEFVNVSESQNPYLYMFGSDWLKYPDDEGGISNAAAMAGNPRDNNSNAMMSLDVTTSLIEFLDTGYNPEKVAVNDGSTYRDRVAIHELLHVLGLAHPKSTSMGTTVMPESVDNEKYTVLSANFAYDPLFKPNDYGFPITPMALDVAALHNMYGAKSKAQSDTLYEIIEDGEYLTDDAENGYVGVGRAYYTIWDTGGVDSIEYNGSDRVLINLNEATLSNIPTNAALEVEEMITKSRFWSDLPSDVKEQFTNHSLAAGGYISSTFYTGLLSSGFRPGGFTIANSFKPNVFDTGIEDARGGSGDDILIGNSLDNLLRGFDGDDFIYGGDGDDMIYGGSGDDVLHGGHGNDKIWGGYGNDIIWSGRGDYTEIQGGGGNDIIIAESDWNYVDAGDNDDIIVIKGQGDYLGWGGSDSFDLTHFTPNSSGSNSVNGVINGEYSINSLYTNSISDFSIRNNGGVLDIYAKGFHVSNIHNFVVGNGFDLYEFAWGNNLSSNYYNQLDIYTMALTGQIDTGGHSYNSGWDIGTITKAAAYSDKMSYANQYIFSFTLPEAAPGMRYISFYNAATAEINGNYYSLPVFTNSITNEFFITPYGALDSFNFDGDTLISGYVTISLIYEDTMEVVSSSSRSFQTVIVDNRPYEWFDDGPSFSSGLPASVHQGDDDLFYVNPHPDYSRGSNDDGHWFG